MINVLLGVLVAVAGAAGAAQSAANAGLVARTNLGVALLTNSVIVTAGTLVLFFASGGPRALAGLPGTPPGHYIGGFCGLVILATLALAFPRLGGALTMALLVLGQGALALVIDHYGLWGMKSAPVSATRLAGVALLVAGVALLRR